VGLASDYHIRGASDLLPLTGERSAPRQFLSVIAPLTAKRLFADRRDQHALTERNSLVVQLDFIHFPEAYGRRLKCFGRPMNIVRE
jgi:hypothetical protein